MHERAGREGGEGERAGGEGGEVRGLGERVGGWRPYLDETIPGCRQRG